MIEAVIALMTPGAPDPLEELHRLLERPAWQRDAACRGQGPGRWFPERGQTLDAARVLCDRCTVRRECLGFALSGPQSADHGVWGGTSPAQRRTMRRTLSDAA